MQLPLKHLDVAVHALILEDEVAGLKFSGDKDDLVGAELALGVVLDMLGYPGHGEEVRAGDVEAIGSTSVHECLQLEDLLHFQPEWGRGVKEGGRREDRRRVKVTVVRSQGILGINKIPVCLLRCLLIPFKIFKSKSPRGTREKYLHN